MMAELVIYNLSNSRREVDFNDAFMDAEIWLEEITFALPAIVFPSKELVVIDNISEKFKAACIHVLLKYYELVVMHEYLKKCKDCEWYKPVTLPDNSSRDDYRNGHSHECLKIYSGFGYKSFCYYASSICDLGIIPDPPEQDRFELIDFE